MLIACAVDPGRAVLHSGAFWDLGFADVAAGAEVRAAAATMAAGREAQRFYAWRER